MEDLVHGCEPHTTASGRTVFKKYLYYSKREWKTLHAMSLASGQSLGRFLMLLVIEEQTRQKDALQARLDGLRPTQ